MPAAGTGRAVTLIDVRGRPMTALVHDPATLADPELRKAVTSAVRLAVENRQLQATVDADARDARTLPTGPVTFLMSDIEDSTGLLHRLGDGYARLLAEVRGIQRTAVRQGGGQEIDARADEYFAVFRQPRDAVDAAVAIQRRLQARTWPHEVDVRLRIGLHHGKPTLTDTGYVGIAVHTTARVCAAGHGGQILVTRAAHEAITADTAAPISTAPAISVPWHLPAPRPAPRRADLPGRRERASRRLPGPSDHPRRRGRSDRPLGVTSAHGRRDVPASAEHRTRPGRRRVAAGRSRPRRGGGGGAGGRRRGATPLERRLRRDRPSRRSRTRSCHGWRHRPHRIWCRSSMRPASSCTPISDAHHGPRQPSGLPHQPPGARRCWRWTRPPASEAHGSARRRRTSSP